jgi:hypothetical protein
MIISHSRRFVFVHIHETAGESVTEALAPHLKRRDLAAPEDRALLATIFRRNCEFFGYSPAEAVRA